MHEPYQPHRYGRAGFARSCILSPVEIDGYAYTHAEKGPPLCLFEFLSGRRQSGTPVRAKGGLHRERRWINDETFRMDFTCSWSDYLRSLDCIFAIRTYELWKCPDSLPLDHYCFYGLGPWRMLDVVKDCSSRETYLSDNPRAPVNPEFVLVVLL